MRITFNWLKDFLDTESSPPEICDKLTSLGFEVEEIIDKAAGLKNFIVAEIISTKQHPNADRLRICDVNTGSEILEIVCGASNARAGIKVALAKVGCVVPNGKFEIKKSTIRGVVSNGMLCSYDELLLPKPKEKEDFDGIIELDSSAKVGENLAKCLGLDDQIIEISITPNRGDALSALGLARELSAGKIGTIKKPELRNIDFKDIDFKKTNFCLNKDFCSQINFIKINNIKNTNSPDWLKNYLQNVGIKTISAVVDITNYVAHSLGQPMHAYDEAKISGNLKVELASGGEEILALDNKSYKLSEGDIVIKDDSSSVQSLAGIIGSLRSGCSLETTSIILESAVFDAVKIFKTASRLNIYTDSRMRFERGVDKNMSKDALIFASNLIQEICGGEVSYRAFDKLEESDQEAIKINAEFVNKKLGTNLDLSKIKEILEGLEFKVINNANSEIEVTHPSFRHDIKIKEDIVEEVARVYGYDNIKPIKLEKKIKPRCLGKNQKNTIISRRILSSLGYNEVITWSFMDSKKGELFLSKNEKLKDELFIANPISSNLDYMRETILPNLLDVVSASNARSIRDVEIFEIGPVFGKDKLETPEEWKPSESEPSVIVGIRTSVPKNKYYSRDFANEGADFYLMKGDFETVLSELGADIDKLQISDLEIPGYYHQRRAAGFFVEIKRGAGYWNSGNDGEELNEEEKLIGYVGQINPKICKDFGIKDDVFGFEIFLNEIPYISKFSSRNSKLPNDYQMIERDFCFVINPDSKIGEILTFIKNIDYLITDVKLFDIYESESIKSIAVKVFIQPNTANFSDEDISRIYAKIIESTEKKFDCRLKL
jgi:phenylalanyl-tRNA synthetase beta chain